MVRRRLALDTQQDLMAWMQSINIKERLRSHFLEALNQKVVRPTKAYSSLLDQLDTEIRLLPSPCTRAALESSMATLEQAQPNKAFDGKSALDVMMNGYLTDLMRVRNYLDAERGGW